MSKKQKKTAQEDSHVHYSDHIMHLQLLRVEKNIKLGAIYIYIYIYILPKALGQPHKPLIKGLTTLVICMSTNLNV